MQTRMLGAVACVSPAHPPNRAALGRWSVVRAPMMVSGAGIERGVCRGQKSKMQGFRCHAWTLASGGPRLTEFRSIASCPMVVCSVGRQVLSGATKGATGVCGAHERPPGRVGRSGSGFGFRSSNFVHPDARKFALGCVAIRKKGGRRSPPGPPPSLRPGARGELRRRCGRGRRGGGPGRVDPSRRARCGVPASGQRAASAPHRGAVTRGGRGAWCRLVETFTRRVRSRRRRDRGAELVEAVAPWRAAPVDGRGLTSARPTHGGPLVYRPTWERDHGQA